MNPSKQFVFFVIAVLLGFGLSQLVTENEEVEVINVEGDETYLKDAQAIKERIITKYITEKNPARRLEAGDEIMEKVMLLFMANLGIKLSADQQNLVQNPTSYDDYLQKVLNLCPELPKSTGPEVFLNDGSDEARKKLEEQLRTCKQTYSGLNKSSKLKTEKQKIKFINFEDNIFKKYGNTPEKLFPFDIHTELWSQKVYEGKLQGFPKSFVEPYLGELDGIYRTKNGEQGYIKIRITQNEKSIDQKVLLNFSIISKIGLNLSEVFSAQHPAAHSNTGKGPCRGLVLSGNQEGVIAGSYSKNRVGHLIKVPGKEGYFGRIYSGDEMVSSFFVMKDFSKKKLNPNRWGRDRGYW